MYVQVSFDHVFFWYVLYVLYCMYMYKLERTLRKGKERGGQIFDLLAPCKKKKKQEYIYLVVAAYRILFLFFFFPFEVPSLPWLTCLTWLAAFNRKQASPCLDVCNLVIGMYKYVHTHKHLNHNVSYICTCTLHAQRAF